jgi:hypothetical protein
MAAGIKKIGNAYDSEWYRDEVAKAERGNREHIARHDRSFYGQLAKLADERVRDDAGQANVAQVPQHVSSTIADLLIESGRWPTSSVPGN